MTAPIVDVHVHAIPPSLAEQVRSGHFSEISESEPGRFLFPGMAPSPPAPQALGDFAGLSEISRAQGITTRLVGPWTDLLGYTLSRDEAAAWTRSYNTALVEACDPWAELEPLATVPLQHPNLAVAELEAAREMGCRGLMIGTDVPGSGLASADLNDVWAAASELDMPALLHPTFLEIPAELKKAGLKNTVARAGTSALALTRLVYSGTLERHPGLALVAAHGGGGFVPLIPRVQRNQELGWADTDVDVPASIARLYWDSVVLDPSYLDYLVGAVGADRVLMGSDHPFPWEPDPVRTVRASSLSPQAQDAVLGETAAALFGL